MIPNEVLEPMLERASQKAIKEFVKAHPCHFDAVKERPHLHAFSRACNVHDAKEDDILIMVYSAKALAGSLKKAGLGLIMVIGIWLLILLSGELIRNPSLILKFFR